MPRWSAGGSLTPQDTMRTGYTLTGTVAIIWIQTWLIMLIGQFKSKPSAIQQ